jgi:AraC-like DNA-binding protein
MNELLEKLNLKIDSFQYSELGKKWNTNNFNLYNPLIPLSRLYYPLEGSGNVLIKEKNYELKPGFIYLIPAYAPAYVSCAERLVKYWGHFNAFILGSDLDIFTITQPTYEIEVEEPELFSTLFQKLIKLCSADKPKRDTLIDMESKSALSLLLLPFLKTINSEKQIATVGTSAKLAGLFAYIEQHLGDGLTLEKLAETVNLNPTYLSNMFTREIGMPLMRYCNERRIRRAMDLMWNSNYSFSEIAYRTGAENVSAFSRLFKRHIGISPQEFKRKIRNSLRVQS